jgi:iron complex transport system permease protein
LVSVSSRSSKRYAAAGLLLFLFGSALGLALGPVGVPVREIPGILLRGPAAEIGEPLATYSVIIWTLRFPRVILAFLEGAALGVAGAVMQGLFRNPMADPYVLGVSSGASLGASLGMVLGIGKALGYWSVPALAFAGALASITVVYALATHRGRTDTWTLLLSGIAVSSLVSSVIASVMVLFRERADEIVFWTMGALSRASWATVFAAVPYTVPGVAVLCSYAGALNALSFGEEPAFHMGVPVERIKRTLLWVSSLVVAGGVAFTGPVGFIGLIVPHAVRLVVGPDHRRLMPLSALMGGNGLLLADLLARTVAPPREIPVGVVTALFGAPFFLYLLFRARRGRR